MDCGGELLGSVGIYEQRIGELQGRAGEGAQDQYTTIILARSNEFLGHEVHSVVERGHHTKRGGVIEAGDFLVGMMALEEDDRFPAASLEPRVDALGFGTDFIEQTLIAVNVGAAGGADLDKGEATLIGRVKLEKVFDAAQPLKNALGVVDAVHANAQKRGADATLVASSGTFLLHAAGRMQRMPIFLQTNADGIGTHTG